MIMTYWPNIKYIICLFKNHDIELIPTPTNKDYGTDSPGTVCIRCGSIDIYKQEKPEKTSRAAKAKAFYIKYVEFIHFAESPAGVACPLPPGPYSNPPIFRTPKDD